MSGLFSEVIQHCFHYEGKDRINFLNLKRILSRKLQKLGQISDNTNKSSSGHSGASGSAADDTSSSNLVQKDEAEADDIELGQGYDSLNTFLKTKANLKSETITTLTKNNFRKLINFTNITSIKKIQDLLSKEEFEKIEKMFLKMDELSFKDLKMLNLLMKKDKTLPSPNLKLGVDSCSLDAINEFTVQGGNQVGHSQMQMQKHPYQQQQHSHVPQQVPNQHFYTHNQRAIHNGQVVNVRYQTHGFSHNRGGQSYNYRRENESLDAINVPGAVIPV